MPQADDQWVLTLSAVSPFTFSRISALCSLASRASETFVAWSRISRRRSWA